jgi:hypothetical protein
MSGRRARGDGDRRDGPAGYQQARLDFEQGDARSIGRLKQIEVEPMRSKLTEVIAAAGIAATIAMMTPNPAQARWGGGYGGWHGGGWGWGVGAGLLAGAVLGGALAAMAIPTLTTGIGIPTIDTAIIDHGVGAVGGKKSPPTPATILPAVCDPRLGLRWLEIST